MTRIICNILVTYPLLCGVNLPLTKCWDWHFATNVSHVDTARHCVDNGVVQNLTKKFCHYICCLMVVVYLKISFGNVYIGV